MRRRRQVRGVADPPRRIVVDPPRSQVGAEVAGEVAGGDVVGGDDQRRAIGESVGVVEERREQVGANWVRGQDRGGGMAAGGGAGGRSQRAKALIFGGDPKEWAKAHPSSR